MENMTSKIIELGMARLERIFNHGKFLEENVRMEYFTAFQYEKPQIFEDAIQAVIESFKPFPTEPFPSVATLKIATLRVVDENEEEAEHKPEAPVGAQGKDFCEQCHNVGFYLGQDNQARFCDCEKGRYRKAAWSVPYVVGDRKRPEKVQKALDKLPPGRDPHRGLKEWNPTGFFELTEQEHLKWMAAKRAEIVEMDRRRAKLKGLGVEKAESVPTGLLGPRTGLLDAVAGVIGQVAEVRKAIREPGDDEGEDNYNARAL